MDITSLITIIIVAVAAYYIVKFIVSPLVRLIAGILFFLVVIYILQRYFSFNFQNVLGFDLGLDRVIIFADSYLSRAVSFFKYLLGNVPKIQ